MGATARVLCVVFPIGLLWCVVSEENRSVQDLLLRTSVIYDWSVRVPLRTAHGSGGETTATGAKINHLDAD